MPGDRSPRPGARERMVQEGRLLTASWKDQGGRAPREKGTSQWALVKVRSFNLFKPVLQSQRAAAQTWVSSFQVECRLHEAGAFSAVFKAESPTNE